MTTIITPIAAGDAYDDVKADLVTLVEFWLGSGAASGGNTPSTWADIRASLNEIATALGVSTVGNGDSGATARAKINAINDLSTLPAIGDLLARFTTPATDDRAKLIGKLIYDLKAGGIWAELDVLYLTAAADSQAARLNWKSASFTALAVNSPTFVADRGYTGDGSTSRLRTQYTPSADAVNFTINDASAWVYCLTDVTGGVSDIGSQINPHHVAIQSRRTSTQMGTLINDATLTVQATVGTSIGLSGVSRAAGSVRKAWRDGVQVGADSSNAATGVPASEQWICASNPISFSTRQVAAAAWGSALTGLEPALYTAILTYLQGVGAQ